MPKPQNRLQSPRPRIPLTVWSFLAIAMATLALAGAIVYRVTGHAYRLRVSWGADHGVEIEPAPRR